MAYPEKVTFGDKENRKPITDPDGQLSAQEAMELRDKINLNALFHGVHDDLASLQAAFPNPGKGDFAYLKDGSCYRCVNIGWTTDPVIGGGSGITYFKGYFVDGGGQTGLEKLRAAYPDGEPGWRAIIRVVGGNDLEALWDEDDADWFTFEISAVVTKSYVDQGDADTLAAAKTHAEGLLTGVTTSPTNHAFHAGWLQDLDFRLTGYFSFPEEGQFGTKDNPIIQNITLNPGDATYARIDMIVANNQGVYEVIEGVPSADPQEPNYDLATQIRCTIILVSANATTPTQITETTVFAEGAAGEFTAAVTTGGTRINAASANTPISGGISIEGSDALRYDAITFTSDAPVPVDGLTGFKYKLKNKAALQEITHRIQIWGNNDSGSEIVSYLEPAENYGYDSQNTGTGTITIPFVVSDNMVEITKIRFVVYVPMAVTWGFFLDDILLIGGNEAPVADDFVTKSQLDQAKAEAIAEAKKYHDDNASGGLSQEDLDVPMIIDADTTLGLVHIGRLLYVVAAVTITWPAGGIANFKANLECNDTGTATIVDEAATPGNDLSAPNGADIESNGSAHLFKEPVAGKLRISK